MAAARTEEVSRVVDRQPVYIILFLCSKEVKTSIGLIIHLQPLPALSNGCLELTTFSISASPQDIAAANGLLAT